MRRSYVIAAFAAVGLTFIGPLTIDAVDFARAVETRNPDALFGFVQQNPTSPWAKDALRLAENQKGQGTTTSNGYGGGGPGNQGNDNGKGNSSPS